ncbi:SCO2400 family protein, partial [Streptomyces neyagawaensis]
MDYCHPCQRHLNGALACPGCGAPAEESRSYMGASPEPDDFTAEERGEAYGRDEAYERDETRERDEADEYGEAPREGDGEARERDDDGEVNVGGRRAARAARSRSKGREPGDRAARRDRRAAAHRRRRRRLLLVGAGLVLAAGGLSLAELGMEAPPSHPNAASVDDAVTPSPANSAE